MLYPGDLTIRHIGNFVPFGGGSSAEPTPYRWICGSLSGGEESAIPGTKVVELVAQVNPEFELGRTSKHKYQDS